MGSILSTIIMHDERVMILGVVSSTFFQTRVMRRGRFFAPSARRYI